MLKKNLLLLGVLTICLSAVNCKRGPSIAGCMPTPDAFACPNGKKDELVPFEKVEGYQCADPDDIFYVYSDCKSGKGWKDVKWCEFKSLDKTFHCTDGEIKSLSDVQQWGCFHPRDKYKIKSWCERKE